MKVNGCDCSIVIKTTYHEFSSPQSGAVRLTSSLARLKDGLDVPYSEETIREAVSMLQEEASIEGDGVCKAIQKKNGVTGCVVTPLTIGTAPLLLYFAMGSFQINNEELKMNNEKNDMSMNERFPMFVSGTRNLYKYLLKLLPLEDTDCFDLIQDRQRTYSSIKNEKLKVNNERKLYEGCRVKSFELRFEREQAIKLKLDICSEFPAVIFPYTDPTQSQTSEMSGTALGKERFNSDNVSYLINGLVYKNIYGLTIIAKKENGIKTEIWIRRVLEKDNELPAVIDELEIIANLLRDKYEFRHYGSFQITLKKLVLISDETNVNSSDAVIGPVRYYVSGGVITEVFSNNEQLQIKR